MRAVSAHRPRSYGAAPIVVAGLLLLACGDDGGSAERFCGEIDENKAVLTDPALVYSDDIQPLLELYRDIADLAPLAIEAEWRQLLTTYETASTVVPGDAESEQTALAAAFQSESAAVAVADWLRANCSVDIGPLTTIVEQD
jgi:hypothetical protein